MSQRIIQPNELITAYGTRGMRNLTAGKEYVCINGTEAGLFPGRPYVSVIDDDGKLYSCHQSRFEKIEP